MKCHGFSRGYLYYISFRPDSIKHAAQLRVLFPSLVSRNSLNSNAWEFTRRTLKGFSKQEASPDFWNSVRFMETATAMKILAAHDVMVTNSGLEIVMYPPGLFDSQPRPPVPEIRKF